MTYETVRRKVHAGTFQIRHVAVDPVRFTAKDVAAWVEHGIATNPRIVEQSPGRRFFQKARRAG